MRLMTLRLMTMRVKTHRTRQKPGLSIYLEPVSVGYDAS
jgi:hypothetical protein